MKKITSCIGVMMMVGMMAGPVAAQQQQTMPPGLGQQRPDQAVQLTERERAYQQAWQQHWVDTRDLRHELAVKRHEMATMLVKPTETTKEQLLAKQDEIQNLQNKLQDQELAFRWDTRMQYPELITDIYGGCLAPALAMEEMPTRDRDVYYGVSPFWRQLDIGEGYLGPGRMDPLPPGVEERRPAR
jgi:hypothetical protein